MNDMTNPAPASFPITRIIARPIEWPSLKEQPDRSGLKLQWRCFTEDGRELVRATAHPFTDAAAVLLETHKLSGDTLVTLRHEGKGYDSFKPLHLSIAAADSLRRQAGRARLRALSERKGRNEVQHPLHPQAA